MSDARRKVQRDKAELNLVDVNEGRRGMRWKDTLNEFFYRHENDTGPDFRMGQFTGTGNDDVRVATFASDPMFCARTRAHSAEDNVDGYFLVFPIEGDITLEQRGREVAIKPGQFSLLGTEGAHKFIQPGKASFHAALIPGDVMRARRPDIDDNTVRDYTSSGSLATMYIDYANSFCRNAAFIDDIALKRSADHLTDLMGLLVDKVDPASDETAVQVSHYRRALRFIEANFTNQNLTAAVLAQNLGLSDRYLQRIFASNGENVSGFIRRRRIVEACKRLDRRGESHASIQIIAYETGFSDPAHFSRVFRQHTGMSPLEWTIKSAVRANRHDHR